MFQRDINGPVVWSHSELMAISQIHDLDKTEIQVMRNMSAAFIDGLSIGSDPLAISPMEEKDD